MSRTVHAILVSPEGCEHHYGCNERDERRGIAHSVNLSEHREVTRLETEKQIVGKKGWREKKKGWVSCDAVKCMNGKWLD